MTQKTVFDWIRNGTRFRALNGDILIKRKGDGRTVFCGDENKIVRLNAIVPGVKIADATRLQFVHFCPTDYVLVK